MKEGSLTGCLLLYHPQTLFHSPMVFRQEILLIILLVYWNFSP